MDEHDARILKELKEDSKKSNTDLAKVLQVSEGTVRRRIRLLSESGIIEKFTIKVNPKANFLAWVLVKSRPQATREISEWGRGLGAVQEIYETSGEWDILIKFETESSKQFNDALDELRSKEGVLTTETLVVLK